jgi:hypothetical protein
MLLFLVELVYFKIKEIITEVAAEVEEEAVTKELTEIETAHLALTMIKLTFHYLDQLIIHTLLLEISQMSNALYKALISQ